VQVAIPITVADRIRAWKAPAAHGCWNGWHYLLLVMATGTATKLALELLSNIASLIKPAADGE
jgi:hypothetical protein